MGMYGHETTHGVIKPFYASTPLKSQKSKHNIIVSLLGIIALVIFLPLSVSCLVLPDFL